MSTVLSVSGVLMVCLRCFDFFLLNSTLGPIAIWMAKVGKDIVVVLVAYGICYFAFVFGINLVLVNSRDDHCEEVEVSHHQTYGNLPIQLDPLYFCLLF